MPGFIEPAICSPVRSSFLRSSLVRSSLVVRISSLFVWSLVALLRVARRLVGLSLVACHSSFSRSLVRRSSFVVRRLAGLSLVTRRSSPVRSSLAARSLDAQRSSFCHCLAHRSSPFARRSYLSVCRSLFVARRLVVWSLVVWSVSRSSLVARRSSFGRSPSVGYYGKLRSTVGGIIHG